MRAKLAAAAGIAVEEATFANGAMSAGGTRRLLAQLVGNGVSAEGAVAPGDNNTRFSQASYGAHFCEVRVNAVTGETRVARWTSVFAAGRILNTKTATSQAIGGIVFGIGGALTEELVHDTRTGKVVNRDLGEYHLPVHADVPAIDVLFLPERDAVANPLLAKGWASSAFAARAPRSPTRSTTLPACACGTTPSRSTSCFARCRHSDALLRPAPVKHYLLLLEFSDTYQARRSEFRDAHLTKAWAAAGRGELVLAGALTDPLDAGVILFRADSRDVVQAFLDEDPYVNNGLVRSWRIREWATVVGVDALSPLRPGH